VKLKGLGRGLDALLDKDGETGPVSERQATLRIDQLQRGRYQPRTKMDDSSLGELAASIRTQGLMQPILVRPVGDRYEIIAESGAGGAAKIAGLAEVRRSFATCRIRQRSPCHWSENIQRENLNPLEEAGGVQRLIGEFKLTHQEAAEAIGRSRTATTNLLRLLNLQKAVQALVFEGKLGMGHARALLALDGRQQESAAKRIADQALSVRQTERLVNAILHPAAKARRRPRIRPRHRATRGRIVRRDRYRESRSSRARKGGETGRQLFKSRSPGRPPLQVPSQTVRLLNGWPTRKRESMGARHVWPREAFPASLIGSTPTRRSMHGSRERIFCGPSWNYVALEAELPRPGDFKRTFIGESRSWWCATRKARSTSSRTMRPRGVQFCQKHLGNAAEFMCPYHQWTYDLKGNLIGVPFRRGVKKQGGMPADFDPKNHGLHRLGVARRHGVIFASLVGSGTARRVFRPFDAGPFRPCIRWPGPARARLLAPADTRKLEADVREHQGPLPCEPAARVPGELRPVPSRSALESANGRNRPPRRADSWRGDQKKTETTPT